METFEQRLKRYTSQNDLEIFGWLAVYLQNSYGIELGAARKARLYLSVYLLTHAVIQMVAENMFGLRGKDGTRFFLESFVDGSPSDRKFSLVADELHDARNVMAHQGYSSLQHKVEYLSDRIPEGWKQEGGATHINPDVYAQQFECALNRQAYIPKYGQQPDDVRLTRKYRFIQQWLRLDKGDPIAQEIKKLEGCTNLDERSARAAAVNQLIYSAYGIV